MPKTLQKEPEAVDGVDFTPSGIDLVRGELIILRNFALEQHEFDVTIYLTHAIAMLARLKHYEENFQQVT